MEKLKIGEYEFEFHEAPTSIVCNKCGNSAWFHAQSTVSGGKNITYCTICQEEATLREITEEERKARIRRAAQEIEMMLGGRRTKLKTE